MQILTYFTNINDGNLALHVGDDEKNVLKNREILREKIHAKSIIFMNQIHSDIVKIYSPNDPNPTCDALICDQKNIALAVMVADCIPLLLYDEKLSLIAAVHAGRMGVFKQIATKTIDLMKKQFRSNPKDIKALIGPAIGKCCYQIDGEALAFGQKHFAKYLNKDYLDLKTALKDELVLNEVKNTNITLQSPCTKCDERYFSYRQNKQTGRFAGLIISREEHA